MQIDNDISKYPGFSETIDFLLASDITRIQIDYQNIIQFLDRVLEKKDLYLYAMPSIILKAAYWHIEKNFPEKLFVKDKSRILAYGGNIGKKGIEAKSELEHHKLGFCDVDRDTYEELISKLGNKLERKMKIKNGMPNIWIPVVDSTGFVWFDRCGSEKDDFLPSKLYNSNNYDGKSFGLGCEIARLLGSFRGLKHELNIIATGVCEEERIGRVDHFQEKIKCSLEMGADYIFVSKQNLVECPKIFENAEKYIIPVGCKHELQTRVQQIAMEKSELSDSPDYASFRVMLNEEKKLLSKEIKKLLSKEIKKLLSSEIKDLLYREGLNVKEPISKLIELLEK